MPASVKVSGGWKTVNGIFVRDAGSWKEVQKGYVKEAGEWKLFYEAAASLPTKEYLTSDGVSGSINTHTFSGVDFGSAAADRYLLAVTAAGGINNATPSVSIGGVAATRLGSTFITGSHIGLLLAHVPSGTSGDVTINWSANVDGMGYSLYRLTGISATPRDTQANQANGAADAVSLSITVAVNDILIAAFHARQNVPLSWTGVATEDFEGFAGFSGSNFSNASEIVTVAGTRAVTGTASGATTVGRTLIATSLPPAS